MADLDNNFDRVVLCNGFIVKKILEFIIPVEIVSTVNKKMMNIYMENKRRSDHRETAYFLMSSAMHKHKFYPAIDEPLTIKFIRISPAELDDDNLPTAFKSYRDEIAKTLGRKNDKNFFTWQYEQDKHGKTKCGIVEIWGE